MSMTRHAEPAVGTPPAPGRKESDGRTAQRPLALRLLARAGYTHGDLSPYNLLVHGGRLVLIDLPQVVDIVANPQGASYLERDCTIMCRWFAARGLATAELDQLFGDLMAEAVARL